MGWTSTHKRSDESLLDFFVNSGALRWSGDSPYVYRVLDSGTVQRSTFYAAVERVHKETEERVVFAVVFLVRWSSGYYNISYKDMDETVGPYEDKCPERILKLLTPTDSEHAKDWRARCWARIEKRKSMKKVTPGTVVEYCGHKYKLLQPYAPRKGWAVERLSDLAGFRMKPGQLAQATIVQVPA